MMGVFSEISIYAKNWRECMHTKDTAQEEKHILSQSN